MCTNIIYYVLHNTVHYNKVTTMARTGVDFYRVSQAAKTLQERGVNPTVDLVRVELGTGSKSTIGPLLKKWKQTNLEAANAEALPEELTKTVRALLNQLQQAADIKVDEMAEEFSEEKDKLVQELVSERVLTDQRDATIKELESRIETLLAENKEVKQDLDASKLEAAKHATGLSEVRNQLQDSKNQVSDLKEEVKQVKVSREHYYERVAKDREEERKQFRSNKSLLETHISDLNSRLSSMADEKSRLETQKDKSDELARMLQDNIDLISSEREVLKISESKLQQDNTRLNSEITINTANIGTLEVTLKDQIGINNGLQTSNKVLESENNNNLTKIEELNDKVIKQTDENKELIAENSRIFGQYKQLEKSINNSSTES